MATAYRSIREHLDDVIALATLTFRRRRTSDAASVAELDLQIVDLGELIERRMEVSARNSVDLPLGRLREAFQLEVSEQRCVWLLLAVAVSAEVRELAGASGRALPLQVLDEIVYARPEVRDRFPIELGDESRLVRYRVIESESEPGVLLARSVRIAERIVDLAYGLDRLSGDVARFASLSSQAPDELLVADTAREGVRAALRRQVEGVSSVVPVVRGSDGAGRRTLVASVAQELGARTLFVRCADLPADASFVPAIAALKREAILQRAVIVLGGIHALAEGGDERMRALDAALAGYPGPVAATAPRTFAGTGLVFRGVHLVDLAPLTEAERKVLWRRHLGDELADNVVGDVAARYRLTGGQIAHAARACSARTPTLADLHAAVSTALDDKLAVLGTRIEWRQRWEDLVLPDESYDEIIEMISRVRYRKQVLDDWGFGDKIAKGFGITALFSGPPGTGKTMAAGLVAQELGLDLYQIDLSRMVSKYIGETEKNLGQLFDAAESGHAILLFDEADALFSKRTEVKSSNDRYANLEVNYLLQRMEGFQGISILTTNFDHAIDVAFRRRLSLRIAFTLPEREERRRLWTAVIPKGALGSDINFGVLADRFEMSGGYIKNAAVRAAYLAAAEGTQISMRHLLRAAASEYAAMGKVVSEQERRALR